MTELEYIDFHIKTVWEILESNQHKILRYENNNNLCKEVPSYYKGRPEEKNYHIVEDFDTFKFLCKQKGDSLKEVAGTITNVVHFSYDKTLMNQYLDKVIVEANDEHSQFFMDNSPSFMRYAINQESLIELLPKMSYEKSLYYFSNINVWDDIYDYIKNIIPTLKTLDYGQDLLCVALKNCSEKEQEEAADYKSAAIRSALIDNYSDKELKRFDFLQGIKSYLENKNKPKDITINTEEFFTTKASIDCSLAKDIFYLSSCETNQYVYIINKLSEYFNKEKPVLNGSSILGCDIINKFTKDDRGRNADYIITDIFVDTKENEPNFKKYLTNLINRYFEDSVNEAKASGNNMDWDKFTSTWLLQESLKTELNANNPIKPKSKKI